MTTHCTLVISHAMFDLNKRRLSYLGHRESSDRHSRGVFVLFRFVMETQGLLLLLLLLLKV